MRSDFRMTEAPMEQTNLADIANKQSTDVSLVCMPDWKCVVFPIAGQTLSCIQPGFTHADYNLQGYSNYGTYFKFEGSQNTVTFGPTTSAVAQTCNAASISVVNFTGHNLSEKVRLVKFGSS